MKRKLIRQGASTLTVSLPTSWTKKFNLEPGDEVEVDDNGRELCLFADKGFKSKKTTIDVSDLNITMIRYYINSLYIRGDDELEFTYDNPKQFDLIQESLDFVLGYAVINQRTGSCTIKDLSGTTNIEFESILRRVFYMILSFGDDGLDMLKKKEQVQGFWKRDLTIDKYVFYSLRMLSKLGHNDFEKTRIYYDMLLLLEQLADEYARFFKLIENQKINPNAIETLAEVNKMFREFFELFYNYDAKKAQKILEMKKTLRQKCLKENHPTTYYLTKISEEIANLMQIHLQLVL